MKVNLSRSDVLIAAMHLAALKVLAAAPNGQLKVGAFKQAIESTVPLDDWARTVYDNGNTRWRSIFAFASADFRQTSCRLAAVWRQIIFYAAQLHTLFNWVEFAPTHPPHVLVSAKVLLQSRRAKGGFSFGVLALHG